VCALHEHEHTLCVALIKIQKCKFYWVNQRVCSNIFSNRLKSCRTGVTTRSVASRKLVWSDPCNEGSETAKFGTDEQKVHKRQLKEDECPQQHDVRTQQSNVETSRMMFF
jgi:hypothetical protein